MLLSLTGTYLSSFAKTYIKQHAQYFNFRCKIMMDLLYSLENDHVQHLCLDLVRMMGRLPLSACLSQESLSPPSLPSAVPQWGGAAQLFRWISGSLNVCCYEGRRRREREIGNSTLVIRRSCAVSPRGNCGHDDDCLSAPSRRVASPPRSPRRAGLLSLPRLHKNSAGERGFG